MGARGTDGLFSAAELVGWVTFVDDFVWGSAEGRRVMIALPVSLLIGTAALWGLMRGQTWRAAASKPADVLRSE